MINVSKIKFKSTPKGELLLSSIGYLQSRAIDNSDQLSPVGKGTLPYRRASSPNSVMERIEPVLVVAKKLAGVGDDPRWQSAQLVAAEQKGDRVTLSFASEYEGAELFQRVTIGAGLLSSPHALSIDALFDAANELLLELLGVDE